MHNGSTGAGQYSLLSKLQHILLILTISYHNCGNNFILRLY